MQLRRTGLTWHVVGGEVVVLDLDGSVYLKVNGAGRVLWELLADRCDPDELTAALAQRYGIDAERAHTDVAAFLSELRRRDLLVS